METTSTSTKAGSKKKKILLVGLGALGLTLLTFFTVRFWNKSKKKAAGPPPQQKPNTAPAKPKAAPKAAPAPAPGAKIKQAFNSGFTAKRLHDAVTKKDFSKALKELSSIKTIKDYNNANKFFRLMRTGGKRLTISEGLATAFKDQKQKDAFRAAFHAMGFKYVNVKGPVSGLEALPQIITIAQTRVWKNPKVSIAVPANMVLGQEVSRRGDFILFENSKQFFLVESKAVTPYKI